MPSRAEHDDVGSGSRHRAAGHLTGFWPTSASWLARRTGLVALIGVLLTVAFGAGISRLEFSTSTASYLNKDDRAYKDNIGYQDLFGGDALLTVITMDPGHRVDELFTKSGTDQFEALHQDLTKTSRYTSVITPLVALQFSDRLVQGTTPGGSPTSSVGGKAQLRAVSAEKPGSPAAKARQTDAAKTLGRIDAVPAAKRTLDNPAWVKVLLYDNQDNVRLSLRTFFPDQTHAQIIVRLKGNLAIEPESRDATYSRKRTERLALPHATTVTAGAPILLKDINDYLRGGMFTLGGIALLVMMVILLVLFRVRWRLLPIGIVLVGVLWAFGLAGYLGIPLTIVTIAGLPVLLGIGIDYAIQMQARIEEEIAREATPGHALQATARGLCPALLVVTFDAVFAFGALQFARVPMIRHFGALLAVGIAVVCVVSIVMPLVALGARERRHPSAASPPTDGSLGRLTMRLGSTPPRFALVLMLISAAVFAAGVTVEGRLVIQTDPQQWLNQRSQTVKAIHEVERQVGGANEMGVFVRSDDVFSQPTVDYVDAFTQRQLGLFGPDGSRGKDLLLTDSSIVQVVSDLLVVPGASHVVPTGAEVKSTYAAAPPDIQASTVADRGQALNIVFRTGSESLARQAPIVTEIRDKTTPPPGTTITPSGLAVVGVGLLQNLESNRILLIYLSMAFVFAFLTVRLRSFVRAALSMIPVGIAVGAASLVAWTFSLQLSPMTAISGPLIVAVCTEFTSLILLRFVEERHRGLSPEEAMAVTAGRTGRAFVVSGLTAITGVGVLALSSLPLLRGFGLLVALNVTIALLSALVILPPLLIAAEQHGWVTRGLRSHELAVDAE